MKKMLTTIYITALFLLFPALVSAQEIINGFVLQKGKMDFGISFTQETTKKFYFGTELVDLPPGVGKYKVQSWSAYFAYGLTDDVDIVLNLPYTKAYSSDDDSLEEKGLQDASAFIKWRAVSQRMSGGQLSIVLGGGVTFPASDYVPDTLISIGNQATSIDTRAAIQYRFDSGLFAELQGGYSFKSTIVPDAYVGGFKLGYGVAKFYLDGWVHMFNSTDGPDIGDPGFTLPATKVNYVRIGATFYYSIVPKLGLVINWVNTVDGRNIKKSNSFSSGLILRL